MEEKRVDEEAGVSRLPIEHCDRSKWRSSCEGNHYCHLFHYETREVFTRERATAEAT